MIVQAVRFISDFEVIGQSGHQCAHARHIFVLQDATAQRDDLLRQISQLAAAGDQNDIAAK